MSYLSNCGYSAGGRSYSGLEKIACSYSGNPQSYSNGNVSYMLAAQPSASHQIFYEDKKDFDAYSKAYHAKIKKQRTITYTPAVNSFLAPDRPLTSFIGHAGQIKEFIEQAFYKTTGKLFPKDIIVNVLSDEDFNKVHKGKDRWDFSIRGFAINRKPFGFSEVFVRQDCLDKVMVTLGHELGHVMSRRLTNDCDEEAKAFAFCIAWLRAVKEHNIANLAACIRIGKPAENNIHDKALEFVQKLIIQGLNPLEIFDDLSNNLIRVESYV